MVTPVVCKLESVSLILQDFFKEQNNVYEVLRIQTDTLQIFTIVIRFSYSHVRQLYMWLSWNLISYPIKAKNVNRIPPLLNMAETPSGKTEAGSEGETWKFGALRLEA